MAPRARKFKWRYTHSEKKKADGGVVSPQLSQFHTWHDTERRVPSESGRPLSSGSAFRYHLPTYLPTYRVPPVVILAHGGWRQPDGPLAVATLPHRATAEACHRHRLAALCQVKPRYAPRYMPRYAPRYLPRDMRRCRDLFGTHRRTRTPRRTP